MYVSYLIANQCKCVVLLGPNYKIIFRVLSRIFDHITEFVYACFEAEFDRIIEVVYTCFEVLSVFKDFIEEGIDWSRRKETVLTNCSRLFKGKATVPIDYDTDKLIFNTPPQYVITDT